MSFSNWPARSICDLRSSSKFLRRRGEHNLQWLRYTNILTRTKDRADQTEIDNKNEPWAEVSKAEVVGTISIAKGVSGSQNGPSVPPDFCKLRASGSLSRQRSTYIYRDDKETDGVPRSDGRKRRDIMPWDRTVEFGDRTCRSKMQLHNSPTIIIPSRSFSIL
jgi:hypothetical protein